jgi:heterodisulfide reductase subunit A
MAVAKSRLQEPLKTESVGVTPACLVIGGGIAGMNAALNLAEQGFPVHLVEQSARLGGALGKLGVESESGVYLRVRPHGHRQ